MDNVQDEVIQTIDSIADLNRLLAEIEAAGELMVDYYMQTGPEEENTRRRYENVRKSVGDAQHRAKSLRAYLSRLQSTIVLRDLIPKTDIDALRKLGFAGYVDEEGVEVSIPFNWLAASSSFIFRAKERKEWEGLSNVAGMWHTIMSDVLTYLKPHIPFQMPLKKAQIDIVLYKPVNNLGDPDHFWMRPVIDSFVNNRVILSDHANNVHLHVGYEHDSSHPELRIRVSPLPDNDSNGVRKTGMTKHL